MNLLLRILEAIIFALLCLALFIVILFAAVDGEPPEAAAKPAPRESFSYCISTDSRPCKLPEATL